jgi:EmrB/QacA subfamily drug resistance transporter
MLLLDVTIVTVALPDIQTSLRASFSDVQWVIDAYALTLAAGLLTAGVLADRYGRRLLFAIGLVVFTLGSLLCGVAQNPTMLLLSRSGQGIGGAIMFATSLALLANSFRGKDRGVAFAVWGAITGVATALGPILGGALTSLDWRWIFLVNLPVGIAALAVTIWRVEESRVPHPAPPDWAGFGLLTTGLTGLVYGLIRASEKSWSDSGVVISLVLGGVLLVAFLVVEKVVAHPLLDVSLFRTPTFVGGSVAAFTMNGSLFAMFIYLVLYLQNLLGYSPMQTGLRLLIVTSGTFFAAALAGRLSERISVRWLIGPGLLLVGAGLLLMAGLDKNSSWTHLIPGFIVAGIGSGLVNPPLASTAVGVVRPEQAGMASGVNSTFRQIGLATAVAALGSIFTTTLRRDIRDHLAGVPGLSGRSSEIAEQVRQGGVKQLIGQTPPNERGQLVDAIQSSFVSGINNLLIVVGIVALAGGVISLLLIRRKDFASRESHDETPQPARANA